MVSQRQLEANRANAKRSTGPKSASGKARSRLNAVTHGLTSRQLVVGAEKPEDFDAFRDEASAIPEGAAILERLPTPRHKSLTNGLAFAMQCKGTKTILTFHFAKDFVRSAIETLIVDAPNILPQSLL